MNYAVSLVSMSVAGICTAPFDTIKTRLQMQRSIDTALQQRGFVSMGTHIVRTESWRALFKGVTPMLGRAVTHGALRMTLFAPAKDALTPVLPAAVPPLLIKVAAGAISGAFAALASNPLELLKVRAQNETGRTSSPWLLLRQIMATEGVVGLWKGVTASMQRSALLNVGQLAVYDQIKHTLRDSFALNPNTMLAQVCASILAGLVTSTVTNPADVVKTRLMNQAASANPQYRGAFHALRTIVRQEGLRALLKGWLPNFSRQGPQTVILLFVAESLRRVLDMPPV